MDVFSPSAAERVRRARADLGIGLPVVISDGEALALVAAAEVVPPERLAAMVSDGDAALALTGWRAETLKVRLYDGDMARIALAPGTAREDVMALIDPAGDLATPMKGPFTALRGGEAGPARAGIALAKAARLLPAVVTLPVETVPEGLTVVEAAAVLAPSPARLQGVVSARLPIQMSEDTRLHVFRPGDGTEEHYAVEVGRIDRSQPVLTRLHSACFTGDVLGSLKCDCGPQLHAALHAMAEAGGGLLLYLNQEGRGIGLANKMRAYSLQDQGFDTVEANHRLGFDDDERDFGVGTSILTGMGVKAVRLMTNNPRKVARFMAEGIHVAERVPLWVGETRFNRDYLRIKAEKSGHMA